MTNPLLAEVPPALLEEVSPFLSLAWMIAGILVRARERLRRHIGPDEAPTVGSATLLGLKDETMAIEQALVVPHADAVRAEQLRLQVRVPLPAGEDLDLLCERLAMQDESWCFVGAWKQVTSYEFDNPLHASTERGTAPCTVCTTTRPTIHGMDVTHEEPVGMGTLGFRCGDELDMKAEVRPGGGCEFQRVARRPWSRREDAANAISDIWVRLRRPWSESGQPRQKEHSTWTEALMAGRTLAAAGFASSEIWDNHQRALAHRSPEADGGAAPASLWLIAWYARPVDRTSLPGIVARSRVSHRMEKQLRTLLLTATISCESEAPTFQAAEQGLWQHVGQGAAPDDAVHTAVVRKWITLEPADVMAWLRDTAVSPLVQAMLMLRPLVTLGLVPAAAARRSFVPCGPGSGEVCAETLWNAAFLSRPCPPEDVLITQLPLVYAVADQLEQGRLCENVTDLFGEWGIFYSGEAEHGDDRPRTQPPPALASIIPSKPTPPSGPKPYPTSGSMPRLYRPGASAVQFIVRPKLFSAELRPEDRLWTWER